MNSLKSLATKWIEDHKFLDEISLLYIRIYDTLQTMPQVDIKVVDWKKYETDLKNGIPVLKSNMADILDIHFTASVFDELTKLAFDESLPKEFAEKAIKLNTLIDNDKTLSERIIKAVSVYDEDKLQILIPNEVNIGLVNFFAWVSIAYALSPYLAPLMKWVEESGYNEAYCPTCGSEPIMAQLKKTKKGRTRYLSCGSCKTKWSYKRIGCPYCGNTDQSSLGLLEVEEESDIRIDICDKCDSYIKTYTTEGYEGIALEDWASIHLDIMCKDTKYKKHGSLLIVE